MALTLKDLETIMAPLSLVGKQEDTFDVNGLAVTLRTLTPEEEVFIQRYARAAFAEGDTTDQTGALDFLDRLRNCTLGHAITQIGTMDFRGVEYVETGEKLANGTAVKVRKHEALMGIIQTWSRGMTTSVFKKFSELVDKVEKEVETTIHFDDVDYDAEIARLEEKIGDLKIQKSQKDLGSNDLRSGLVKRAAMDRPFASTKEDLLPTDDGAVPEAPSKEPFGQGDMVTEEGSFVAVPSDVKKSVELPEEHPKQVVPPVRKPLFDMVKPMTPIPVRVPQVPAQAPQDPLESSFVDTSDPNVIEAENHRLMELRSRTVVKPPHFSAREAFQEVQKTEHQVESTEPPVASVVLPKVVKSNLNPRFKPPVNKG